MATLKDMMLAGTLGLTACETGAGAELALRVYGEEFIEEGIPASVFDDGWTVAFDRFLINLGAIEVSEAGAAPSLAEPTFQVFDLTAASSGEGQAAFAGEVPAGAYTNTRYKIHRAGDDSLAGNAAAEDVEMMKLRGFSVFVSGMATKDGMTKTFAWGWQTATSYEHCESQAVIEAGKPGAVQITIHGDHLFLDDLFSETPMVLFGLVAQADDDGDGDGEITQAELEAVDLRPLANYQVGSTGITDLWHFLEHLTTLLGHIDGEGHCESIRES
jgi:hypothetical protein